MRCRAYPTPTPLIPVRACALSTHDSDLTKASITSTTSNSSWRFQQMAPGCQCLLLVGEGAEASHWHIAAAP